MSKALRRMGFWTAPSPVGHGDDRHDLLASILGIAGITGSPEAAREEVLRYVAQMHPMTRAHVLHYMASSRVWERYMGWAECRLCGAHLGSADMITPDGRWVFPEKWEHYIIAHGVAPTDPDFSVDAVAWSRRQKENP